MPDCGYLPSGMKCLHGLGAEEKPSQAVFGSARCDSEIKDGELRLEARTPVWIFVPGVGHCSPVQGRRQRRIAPKRPAYA